MSVVPTRIECEHAVVETRSLAKTYRATRALDGLDLTVPDGSVYLLVGPNGAGKTTTLKILLDLVRPSSGEALVFGRDPASEGAIVRAGIGYVPEGPPDGVGWMRVGRFLRHMAAFRPTWDEEYAASLVRDLELDPNRKMGRLSKGQSRRVQIAAALAYRPPLLLLDEPAEGLDPVVRDRLNQILVRHISETRTTMLVSTHHIQEMERLADHMGVIRKGRLIAQQGKDHYGSMLRRYLFEPGKGWAQPADLESAVLHRNGSGAEAAWTIWGDEERVRSRLSAAGASVRAVETIPLEEAAVALLTGKEA